MKLSQIKTAVITAPKDTGQLESVLATFLKKHAHAELVSMNFAQSDRDVGVLIVYVP